MSQSSARHGIGGALALVTADKNNDKVVLHVHHVLDDNLNATTHITEEQLRKAAGISHMNNNRFTGMTLETKNDSDGLVAITVKSGDGEALPLTDRACIVSQGGSMAAANHVAMPNGTTVSHEMTFKKLTTDKHNFVPLDQVPSELEQRNKLNAALYPGASAPPCDDSMFRHTVRSTNGTAERVAIPLKDRLTEDDGVLTAVASRNIIHQKKSATTFGGSDARVVTMPHRDTGEDCKHLVVSAASAASIADTIKSNTKIHGTFGNGLRVSAHGNVGEHARPGDHVITKVTLHRLPTGEKTAVTYQTDLMPKEIQASAAPPAGSVTNASANDDVYRKHMWSAKTADSAQIVCDGEGEETTGGHA